MPREGRKTNNKRNLNNAGAVTNEMCIITLRVESVGIKSKKKTFFMLYLR